MIKPSNNKDNSIYKDIVDKKDKNNSFVKEIKQKLKISSNNCKSNYINEIVEGLGQ